MTQRLLPYLLPWLILNIIGWLCVARPTLVIRILSLNLDLQDSTREFTKSYQIAKYVREHPDTWPQQYPGLFKRIQLIGFGAYAIFAVSILIFLMEWLMSFVP